MWNASSSELNCSYKVADNTRTLKCNIIHNLNQNYKKITICTHETRNFLRLELRNRLFLDKNETENVKFYVRIIRLEKTNIRFQFYRYNFRWKKKPQTNFSPGIRLIKIKIFTNVFLVSIVQWTSWIYCTRYIITCNQQILFFSNFSTPSKRREEQFKSLKYTRF